MSPLTYFFRLHWYPTNVACVVTAGIKKHPANPCWGASSLASIAKKHENKQSIVG
jgi:hypothetical protein